MESDDAAAPKSNPSVETPARTADAETPKAVSKKADFDLITSAVAAKPEQVAEPEAPEAEPADPKQVAAIKETMTEFGAGLQSKDVVAAMRVITDDYYMTDSADIKSKQDLRDAIVEMFIQGNDPVIKYEIDDATITVDGREATANPMLLHRASGEVFRLDMRFRRVFDDWMIYTFSSTSGVA